MQQASRPGSAGKRIIVGGNTGSSFGSLQAQIKPRPAAPAVVANSAVRFSSLFCCFLLFSLRILLSLSTNCMFIGWNVEHCVFIGLLLECLILIRCWLGCLRR